MNKTTDFRHFLGIKAIPDKEEDCVIVYWSSSPGENRRAKKLNTHPLLEPVHAGRIRFDFSQLPEEDWPCDILVAAELMAAQELLFKDKQSPCYMGNSAGFPVDGHESQVVFSQSETVSWVRATKGPIKMFSLSFGLYCRLYSADVISRDSVLISKKTGKHWHKTKEVVLTPGKMMEYRKGFTVRSKSIGEIVITPHALDRYAERVVRTTHSHKEAERPMWSLVRFLTQAVFRTAYIEDEKVIEAKKSKYDKLHEKTRYWKSKHKELYLVTVPSDSFPRLNLLITVFFRTKKYGKIRAVGEM